MGESRRVLVAELPAPDVSGRPPSARDNRRVVSGAAWREALAPALKPDRDVLDIVSSPSAALEALDRHPYDLLIVDTDLGQEQVLAHPAAAQARILLTAAEFDNHTVIAALRGRVHSLLSKAMTAAEVLPAVDAALRARDEPPIEVVSAQETWLEVLVPCTLPAAERVLSFLARLHSDLPDHLRDAMNQALRELLSNAVEWGGRLDPEGRVRVTCMRGVRLVVYRIADPGQGFRIDALPHAAVSNPADSPLEHALVREEKNIRPGGFGISLVRGLVDELLYNERHNEVIFIKYLARLLARHDLDTLQGFRASGGRPDFSLQAQASGFGLPLCRETRSPRPRLARYAARDSDRDLEGPGAPSEPPRLFARL